MNALPVAHRPPAVARSFDRIRAIGVAPLAGDAEQSERALLDALRPVVGSVWPEIAWRFGTLTATGYPVELAWASRDAALRWTCEVAGPETPESSRLALAAEASGIDIRPWGDLQRGRRLRYGAWLGARHQDGRRRSKVYLELPAGPWDQATRNQRGLAGLPGPVDLPAGPWAEAAHALARAVADLHWRMAGLNDDGSVELYARLADLTPLQLTAASRLVFADDALRPVVRHLIGAPDADRTTPSGPAGLSLVLSPQGDPLAVTWFTIAKWAWGDDATARAAVLRTADLVGTADASRSLYEALSSGPDDGRWRHGMVGAGIDLTGRLWLQAGLRPT